MNTGEHGQYRSWIEVDLGSFDANWKELRRLVGNAVQIMQVVKADGYGHGAIEISNAALKNGASLLGVANADEGVQLRASGINAPIAILSPATGAEIEEILKYSLTPSVSDLGFADKLQAKAAKARVITPVHIEIDTGMGRGGILRDEAIDAIQAISALQNIKIEGIFTHFSESETVSSYNIKQWRAFQDILMKIGERGWKIPLRHISNSGAVINYPEYSLDLVRPGLMTYGIHPSAETRKKTSLLPVMSFKTRVALVKEFPEGSAIGYGRTFITRRATRIATIPVGYGDGLGWILSNQGEALIKGKRVSIAGRISMDMCTLDVSDVADCTVGDEVVLMGRQQDQIITAEEIASKLHTISYEILCALGKRAPRVFIRKGKADRVEPRLRRIYIPGEEKSIARIDGIIRSCFQARANNEDLGNAIYSEMFEILFGKNDRMLDLREDFYYRIAFSEFSAEEIAQSPNRKNTFKVTARVEYTKELRNTSFMIGCAFDEEKLSALFENPQCEYRWLLNRDDFDSVETDFQVKQVIVDGEEIPLTSADRTQSDFERWFGSEHLKKKQNRPVRFAIEIETRQNKDNRVFSAYIVYPTKGMNILFHYAGTGIKNVREVGFFSGKHRHPEIMRNPGESVFIRSAQDEWIFPTSGVTFLWDL
jgi:alanine racemase